MLLKKSGGYEPRDPSVIFHNGKFYHCYTRTTDQICVAESDSMETLGSAEGIVVYTPEANKPYSKQLWAPELHVIDGICYVYVACDDGQNANHRMYVLTNDCGCPTKPYRMAGKLTDESDKWAIDGTVFRYRDQLYTVWSGWAGEINDCQNLYIARLSDPCTVASQRVLLSTPEYDWEKRDCVGDGVGLPLINEGPCAYLQNGELKGLLYSASGSWANHYCMGYLTFVGEDPMDPASWRKEPMPALSMDDGWNGPGHCSVFFNGERDYIAFHTYDEGATRGWSNVHAVIMPFEMKDGRIVLIKDKK